MRPVTMLLFGLGLMTSCLLLAGDAPQPQSLQPLSDVAAVDETDLSRIREEQLRSALDARIDVAFNSTALRTAMRRIGEKIGIEVWIDESPLADEGIAPDDPVTFAANDVSVTRILNRVLSPKGLTWLIEDEVLKITTRVKAEETLVTRAYDLRRLLEILAKDPPDVAGTDAFHFAAGVHVEGFSMPSVDTSAKALLVNVLFNATSGNWADIDGTGGTESWLGGVLTVRQTQQIHGEIESLFDGISRLAFGETREKQIPIRRPGYPFEDDAAIRAALHRPVAVDLRNTDLRSAMAALAEQLHIRVILDENGLADEGIAPDDPISLAGKKLTLGSLLHREFQPRGLAAVPDEGFLLVTTQVKADEMLYSVVYDVSGAIGQATTADLEMLLLNTTSGNWEMVDGTGGTITFASASIMVVRQTEAVHQEIRAQLADLRRVLPPRDGKPGDSEEWMLTRCYALPDAESAADAVEVIPRLVAPESWTESRSIQKVGRVLAVHQTPAVQRQVKEFVQALRQAIPAPASAPEKQPDAQPNAQPQMKFPALGGGFF